VSKGWAESAQFPLVVNDNNFASRLRVIYMKYVMGNRGQGGGSFRPYVS